MIPAFHIPRRARVIALALLVAALASSGLALAPTTTLAKQCVRTPSGNSSVNQYVEDIPTACGGKPTSGVGKHHSQSTGATVSPGSSSGGSTGSPIPASTYRRLRDDGKAGRAATALADSTAAASTTSVPQDRVSRAMGAATASPASQVLKTLGGSSGGLGSVLPAILIGALAVISAAGIVRRRHDS